VGLRAHVRASLSQYNTSVVRCNYNQQRRIPKKMPVLTPSFLPPPVISAFPSPSCPSSNGTRPSATPTSPKQGAVTQRSDMPSVRKRALKIPFVRLDTPTIQDDMAASLAVALLGHVLFLKSQVPLCVAFPTRCRTVF
jgi:hypothetical protein